MSHVKNDNDSWVLGSANNPVLLHREVDGLSPPHTEHSLIHIQLQGIFPPSQGVNHKNFLVTKMTLYIQAATTSLGKGRNKSHYLFSKDACILGSGYQIQ